MAEPGVAGEGEVREKVQETRGVQEDHLVVGVEGGERGLGREKGEGEISFML